MNEPILVVMAAGLGSRYGGLKQIAPVDEFGHILIDYALFDAYRAGFRRVVFIIKPELEPEFKEVIGNRICTKMQVSYAHQCIDGLPNGFAVPHGRQKPWGTAHAVLSAKHLVDAPFAVINADDFYGASAFASIYQFLKQHATDTHHAMVGYSVANTLTENGHVARGVCRTQNGLLAEIVERTHIEARPNGAAFTEDGERFTFLPADTTVSMNLWGFEFGMMAEIETRFGAWLAENLPQNPLKCEYFLPFVPNQLLKEGRAQISVLPSQDKWYGVTYAQDMPVVQAALKAMRDKGLYPDELWRVT